MQYPNTRLRLKVQKINFQSQPLNKKKVEKVKKLGCVWFNVKYFLENKYFSENNYFPEMLFSEKENSFMCLVAS